MGRYTVENGRLFRVSWLFRQKFFFLSGRKMLQALLGKAFGVRGTVLPGQGGAQVSRLTAENVIRLGMRLA
jgi:hypothetical protein